MPEIKEAVERADLHVRIPQELADKLDGQSKADVIAKALDLYLNHNSDFELMCRSLRLCPACVEDMRRWCETSGRTLPEIVKYEVWKYWGEWPHGNGCTAEERNR